MRVAALNDVHGNLPALEAALRAAEAEAPDLLVFGGDVAAGPMPVETIERLGALGGRARFVRGNGDRMMVEVFDGRREPQVFDGWPAARLDRAHRDFLASFEPVVEVEVDGLGLVCFCHAVPADDDRPLVTAATPDAVVAEAFAATGAQVVVAGHVHMQFDRLVGGRRWVNAGSVGMPCAARPGAYWALLGPDAGLRRTEYDYEAAAAAIRATGHAPWVDMADHLVQPHTEEEAIDVFERAAGRR
jgi:predicted phosphodiesterase